jgi:hypothetical protein
MASVVLSLNIVSYVALRVWIQWLDISSGPNGADFLSEDGAKVQSLKLLNKNLD